VKAPPDQRALLELLEADSIKQARRAVAALERDGYEWTPLGGKEGNFGLVNIGSDPGFAFVERITNALDAVIDEAARHAPAALVAELDSPRSRSPRCSAFRKDALCAYGELAPERHAGVQTGTRLGAFPVPVQSSSGIPAAWVDLRRISTTDVGLVDVEPLRLASLSSLAQAHLQAALAKHWAYRDLSRYDELQRAFGQRITAVVPISTGKKMRVGFTLEDGAQLVFESSDKPLPPPNAPARRPRPSRS